jgi:hypothetical protein
MHYLTQVGINFLNEKNYKFPHSAWIPDPKDPNPLLRLKTPGELEVAGLPSDERRSSNQPGHEARMIAHQKRIDVRVKANKKYGREDEDRGDKLLQGLGELPARAMGQRIVEPGSIEGQVRQIGKRKWRGARSLPAHKRTLAKSRKKVSSILSLYQLGARTRALPGSQIVPHVKQAADALRDVLNKRRKMRADLEGGSPTLKQSWTT